MQVILAQLSLILLNFLIATMIGGGFYEHIVLTPLWKVSPPSSFAVIQPKTGVPLQRFWIPVHIAITVFLLAAVFLTWGNGTVRLLLLVTLISYVMMRVWSALYFIPEMLAFQKISLDSTPTEAILARVNRWTFWTRFREPLNIVCFLGALLAFHHLKGL